MELAFHAEAVAVRTATAGPWEMRLIVFVAGFPPAAHFAAVCLDSALPGLFPGWTVHALPPRMDQWQGAIILSLFRLAAVKLGAAGHHAAETCGGDERVIRTVRAPTRTIAPGQHRP